MSDVLGVRDFSGEGGGDVFGDLLADGGDVADNGAGEAGEEEVVVCGVLAAEVEIAKVNVFFEEVGEAVGVAELGNEVVGVDSERFSLLEIMELGCLSFDGWADDLDAAFADGVEEAVALVVEGVEEFVFGGFGEEEIPVAFSGFDRV